MDSRPQPIWLRIILNLCGPIGLAVTLMGWVRPRWGLFVMSIGLIYVLWEIWPWVGRKTWRYPLFSLLTFILVGACIGGISWFAVRAFTKSVSSTANSTAPNAVSKQDAPPTIPRHDTNLHASKPKSAIAPNVVFSQTQNGVHGMVMFNATDEPIDNVSFSIMRSHAGPEHDADPFLLQKDLSSVVSVDVGTLLPQLATSIKAIPASMFPYSDRPSSYQVNIFTRHEAFTEYLYVTPKDGSAMFDQSIDLSSNKSHEWIYKNAEKARKNWKNSPEWWK